MWIQNSTELRYNWTLQLKKAQLHDYILSDARLRVIWVKCEVGNTWYILSLCNWDM